MKTIQVLAIWGLVMFGALLLAGCAGDPYVDFKSSDNPGDYYSDLRECQMIAEDIESTAWSVTTGSLMGSFLSAAGAVGVAMITNSSEPLGMVAGIGATGGLIGGGIKGALDADHAQYNITVKCLEGRGYTVLGET